MDDTRTPAARGDVYRPRDTIADLLPCTRVSGESGVGPAAEDLQALQKGARNSFGLSLVALSYFRSVRTLQLDDDPPGLL